MLAYDTGGKVGFISLKPTALTLCTRSKRTSSMIGILGGSGLYDLDGLTDVEERTLETAFGAPSDPYIVGKLSGQNVCFLPRHGRGHRFLPSEINHRANIMGFKMLGVRAIISVSAVGSLKEAYRPRDIVLPDQYFDRTKRAEDHTFFGQGIVAHIPFGDPACDTLRAALADTARSCIAESGLSTRVHEGGTYVNMEGPAFSTRAECDFHRHFGYDVIGMTSLAEAKLCREAEVCYQAMSMITDYDCWHEVEADVSVDSVIAHLMANSALAKQIVAAQVAVGIDASSCSCQSALQGALFTAPDAMPAERKEALAPILGRYLD
jgi:5'-methylthioadenosine phosphorylase